MRFVTKKKSSLVNNGLHMRQSIFNFKNTDFLLKGMGRLKKESFISYLKRKPWVLKKSKQFNSKKQSILKKVNKKKMFFYKDKNIGSIFRMNRRNKRFLEFFKKDFHYDLKSFFWKYKNGFHFLLLFFLFFKPFNIFFNFKTLVFRQFKRVFSTLDYSRKILLSNYKVFFSRFFFLKIILN